jgi:hypothetical protein
LLGALVARRFDLDLDGLLIGGNVGAVAGDLLAVDADLCDLGGRLRFDLDDDLDDLRS